MNNKEIAPKQALGTPKTKIAEENNKILAEKEIKKAIAVEAEGDIQIKAEPDKLREILEKTRDIKVIENPNHYESLTFDSPLFIEIEFADKTTETIGFGENTKFIYRMFDEGENGEQGYIRGYNDELYDYLMSIK